MPSKGVEGHQWTKYELNLMFGLIVRGAHNSDKPQKRTDTAELIRTNFYDEFASDFNKALSGKYNYRADIDKQEIIQMLDSLMAQRVNVIGKGSLAERQKVSRITRSLRLAWDRVPSRDYNGSMAEWNSGRKERVIKADLIRRGLVPAEEQAEPGNKRAAAESLEKPRARAFNGYTCVPRPAPAAYARKYTPRKRQVVPVADLNDEGTYFSRQFGVYPPLNTQHARSADPVKQDTLSATLVNDSNGDEIDSSPQTQSLENHDATMENATSLSVFPVKNGESRNQHWPMGLVSLTADINATGEIGKIKRSGINTGDDDIVYNLKDDAPSSSTENSDLFVPLRIDEELEEY